MKNKIKYSSIKSGEESQVIDIVISIFNEFVAPLYSEEGNSEFYKYTTKEALIERLKANHFLLTAKHNENIIGIIEVRNNNHISKLFVLKEFQNKGIGRTLLDKAILNCLDVNPNLEKITVNSSPNSIETYKKIGFIPIKPEQCINGIRFIPMEKKINI